MKFLYLILSLFPLCGFAQTNLLLNGDFENYSSCPIGYTDQYNPEIERCIGWKAPTAGTSDFFHYCADGTYAGINTNTIGYQQPYSGYGYLGAFLANYTGGTGPDGLMWWEYVQGQFVQPLEQGRVYKIGLYISLAEYSDLMINEFGAYLSSNPISSSNTASLELTPQVTFYNVNYFTDTLNWMYVEESFIAEGGEKYITIGNFKNNQNTDTIRRYAFLPEDYKPYVTYYFIDAAYTFDITDEFQPTNVFTPNGDGINDFWKLPNLPNHEVIIYNRWGNKILQNEVINFSWDGKTKNGTTCSNGTYYYIIQDKTKVKKSFTGFIQLIN